MAALNLVSSNLNINLVFPGAGRNNLKGFQLRRSAGGGKLVVRRGKPSLDIVKCLDNTSILPAPLEPIPEGEISSIRRDYFPSNFKFGASTSAIQVHRLILMLSLYYVYIYTHTHTFS